MVTHIGKLDKEGQLQNLRVTSLSGMRIQQALSKGIVWLIYCRPDNLSWLV